MQHSLSEDLNEKVLCIAQIGLFNAAFLVVTALDLESNNLTDLQRSRWTAAAAAARGTLDIG